MIPMQPRIKYALGALVIGGGTYASYQMFRSDKVKGSASKIADSAKKVSSGPNIAFNHDEFRQFPLKEIEQTTPNTARFRFELPTPQSETGLTVSSCIICRAPGQKDKDGNPLSRPYTPVTRTSDKGFFDLVIKRYETGAMSKFIHSLKPGDKIEVKGPIQKLKYEPNKYKHIGMIAGGTGITPMYQVIREIIHNPLDMTMVDLVFGNVTENDIILKSELDAIQLKHPNIRVHYTVDKPSKDWKGPSGYINEKMLTSFPTWPRPGSNCFVYVCGPPGLVKVVAGPLDEDFSQGPLLGVLKDMGYKSEQVYKF